MSDISLSKAVRSNLLSLQNTADLMATTQNRLATGKKVNSALDNPTNFFTASSLNSRAGDINQLLDGMANGIQTIEAADNGLKSITKTLESMQSTLRQARQDKSFQTGSFELADDATTISFNNGQFGELDEALVITAEQRLSSAAGFTGLQASDFSDADAAETTLTFSVANEDFAADVELEVNVKAGDTARDIAAAINAAVKANNAEADNDKVDVQASVVKGELRITSASDQDVTVAAATGEEDVLEAIFGNETSSATVEGDVDAMVRAINNNADARGKVRASNDNGNLRIENLSTQELTVSIGAEDTVEDASKSYIGGNAVRADLSSQYNELRDQLDKLADDASFNGINLLRGDNLKITFNEIGTSEIDIQSKDAKSINSATLGIPTNMEAADFDSDETIDAFLGDIKNAINEVRSQASAFGSSLSIVENRQDFSKNMINTLQTGAANLTLADSNEEAANLLALQTRQQLSSTALSMASQQDQAVLRLF